MALIPGNPVVGGTVLRRAAIVSPNFDEASPLSSPTPSWGILQDGNAYFFGVTVTGNIVLAGTAGFFEYSGTPALGNSPILWAVSPGTTKDPFGNTLATSGGITSATASAFAQLVSGGLTIGLIGAVVSAVDAVLGISGNSSGQTVSITSGEGPEATPSESVLNLSDSGAAAAGPVASIVSGVDSVIYPVGEAVYSNAGSQTINPAAVTPLTGLSQKVANGAQYYFRGIFRMKQGATNVNQQVGFNGPATSQCVWYYSDGGQGASNTSHKVVVGSLSTVAVGFVAAADEQYLEFEGTVTFSANGTFECVAQAPTAGDSFLIQPGCVFVVRPM